MLTTTIKFFFRFIKLLALYFVLAVPVSSQASAYIIEEHLVQSHVGYFYIRYEFPNFLSAAQWNLYTMEGILVSSLVSVATELHQESNQLLVIYPSDEFNFFEIVASSATSTTEDIFYIIELGLALIIDRYQKLYINTMSLKSRD